MEKRVKTVGKRRKGIAVTAALLSGVLVLSACSEDDGGQEGPGKSERTDAASKNGEKPDSAAHISITPENGSQNAGINNDARVTVKGGKLTEVTMTAVADGSGVEGEISADGTTWQPTGQLERATEYRVEAVAEDGKGAETTENSTFTTVSPNSSFIGYFTPENGDTVGVGMPVSFNFDKAIENKAEVQSAIEVSSTSGQEIVGHWFGDKRLDFRPREYWKPGTQVDVKLALDGVEASNGVTGVQDKSFSFTVGRSQVSTVDVEAHTMTVVRDGKEIKTVPISAGSEETPTYNGQMVISEKFRETRMNGATVGFTDDDGEGEYDIPDVPHAMRLSTSGTFIHGNYWGAPFGEGNTSHGCVGLQDVQGAEDPTTDGYWFFENSLIGDVVTVVNSPDKEIKPDNGLNGWNMSWSEWVAGSAV
ncbi:MULTISPECIES: L,D-transpeptidase [unclassified Streptomyces]|uniref:L,D-transpeptidase n=1 Tax=unclassified Streptomyces TaxID=2593676 RepID=UPI0022B74EA9|nr:MULTISPECIES: Ig-like domain-containing protein [unclassified Streptomyces]MCZ7416885.1 Ig-like domain-containing protein [Streptomyces sp. WMMC897]MCZ7433298.1 Ig-like domain-containing protein [Streptomyces sp. WMMC1477]